MPKKQNRARMIWVSKRPVFKYNPRTLQQEFRNYEMAGGTYVRRIHGPIGTEKERLDALHQKMDMSEAEMQFIQKRTEAQKAW